MGVAYARKSSSVPENGNRPERSGIRRLHRSTSYREYSNVYSLHYPFYVVDVNNLLWSKPESCDSLDFIDEAEPNVAVPIYKFFLRASSAKSDVQLSISSWSEKVYLYFFLQRL